MTDSSPNSDGDEAPTNRRADISRRTYLHSMALAPATLSLPNPESDREVSSSPLVTSEALPAAFVPLDIEQPTPFARRLMERDDRFETAQFSVRGFGETPDGTGPRYVVNTATIELPTPRAASEVRNQITEMFDTYMDRLYDRSGIEWTRIDDSSLENAASHHRAAIRFDTNAARHVDWIDPSQSAQCAEHWVLDTTDRQAVLTLVFGSRQGPWSPRGLLDRTRAQIRRRLDG